MKRLILPFVMLALSGCATVSEMKASGPSSTFESKKDAAVLSQCVLLGWQDNVTATTWYGQSYLQPLGDGYSVYSDGSVEIADFVKNDNGTQVKFYHRSGVFQSRLDARLQAIKNCL
jgi:uncharacterized protein YceK